MGQQSIRQEARRAALDVQSKRRRERAEREKRLEDLAVRVLVAVREREAAVSNAERRAGEALWEMTEDEGLSVREAVEWCGDEITAREATRLRRIVETSRAAK
jgi:predicted solute-binding protein